MDLEIRHGGYGCFFWAGLLVLGVAGTLALANNVFLRPGQLVLLHGQKDVDKIVYIGTVEADARELQTLARAEDDLGLHKLESSGHVFPVTAGTSCRVLEHDWLKSLYRVRIQEGKQIGKDGWVGREFLSQPLK